MPYPQSEANLKLLFDKAINDPTTPEIPQNIKKARWKEEELLEICLKDADQIYRGVLSKLEEYNSLESRLNSEQVRLLSTVPTEPRQVSHLYYLPGWMMVINGILILLFFVSLIAYIIVSFIYGWSNVFSGLANSRYTESAISVLIIWIIAVITISISERTKARKERQDYSIKHIDWITKKKEAEDKLAQTGLTEKVFLLYQDIEQALIGEIKQRLRALINSRLALSYETRLKISGAAGFAEVFNPEYAIDTSARESLNYLLNNMPGGSIGIAGPRGSGKTTLLRLFCGPKRTIKEIQGKPVLPVLVSAPVEYEPRDFILYLFSSICQSVLDMENVEYQRWPVLEFSQNGEQNENPAEKSLADSFKVILRPVLPLAFYLGLLLIALSLFTGYLLSAQPAQKQPTAAQANSKAEQPTESNSSGDAANKPQENGFISFIKALGIQPGTILMWGIFIFAFSIAGAAILGEKIDVFILEKLLGHRLSNLIFKPYFNFRLRQQTQEDKKKEETEAAAAAEEAAHQTGLAGDAMKLRDSMKFQMSYTAGWSGALKLPIGVETSTNRAITMSRNQLSMPEIVYYLTKFLETIATKYKVIIGIDELDKLESDESAQQFLNEIKSVFGVDNCFYLISVSENAMSNFERRGLPFRDAFDSSFDVIIYVDYLNFEAAKNLIEQRVIGRPAPFFALSYCLAGGLARDVIRTFRSLMELKESNPAKDDLEFLGHTVIKTDIKAKIRAMTISAKRIELEEEVDFFLEKLYEAEDRLAASTVNGNELLLQSAQTLLLRKETVKNPNGNQEMAANCEKIRSLMDEMAIYLYYSVTLLQFFTNSLTETSLTQPTLPGGTLDDLAKARQLLAVNSSVTQKMLHRFRQAQEIPNPSLPPLLN
ncbi:MAG TPA: hypothetical protein VJS44_01665 [Pyrinomonadaceae bacterium]|nr:hypothetical protein [Pyrinomonadaceae bacterium]